jgi:hypothetical protein
MGYDPNMAQQMVQVVEPKDVLTWAQIAYYTGGAIVALVVAVWKGRFVFRWWRKRWRKE